MPIQPTEKIWMDGKLIPWDEARIHVLTHSLHYGSGVFEGIRAYETRKGPAIFRLTDHIARLYRSAKIFTIEIPYTPEELVEACKDVVRATGLGSCYLRPLVYLGYGEMGLNPLPCPVNVAVVAWPWGSYLGEEGLTKGVRMKISSWRRHDPNIIPPAAKGTGQYINSQLAKVEAIKAGYDEAIMLNPLGFVAEASGENIFIVRDGEVLTPPQSAGALIGLTSESVKTIARDLGVQVHETDLVRTDLYTADEVFVTGTAAECTPVREIDDRPIGNGEPGPLTRKIQEIFFATVKGEVDKYSDWLEHV
ncbi:MAG TPA: branched-chain amino acid transaminase [Actinomycetota bacterium]|nr:branched-chain amino acid transaminase [Actinomycetota bacterium]